MLTKSLLPFASVTTYDLKRNVTGKTFATEADARKWIAASGTKCFNLYRIEKMNGTWRTDWELQPVAA
jgi:hypothetical protein